MASVSKKPFRGHLLESLDVLLFFQKGNKDGYIQEIFRYSWILEYSWIIKLFFDFPPHSFGVLGI